MRNRAAVAALQLLLLAAACVAAHGSRGSRRGLAQAGPDYVDVDTYPEVPTGTDQAKQVGIFRYSLPNGLQDVDTYLQPADLVNILAGDACVGRDPTQPCSNLPGIGSGLTFSPLSKKNKLQFLGITDRGSNGDCPEPPGPEGTYYNVPEFAPFIVSMSFDLTTGIAREEATCYLKDTTGAHITGLTNGPFDGPKALSFSVDTNTCGAEIPYDVRGLDTEDIHLIPGTDYCLIVGEESPSAAIIDCNVKKSSCGTVRARFVPKGLDLAGANEGVRDILPAWIRNRRSNRGFENAAVSPDGKTALIWLQSAMGPEDKQSKTLNSFTVTGLKLDLSGVKKDPTNVKVTAAYIWLGDPYTADFYTNVPDKYSDLKLSSATWAANYVGEDPNADIIALMEDAKNEYQIYLGDVRAATNILDVYTDAELAELPYDSAAFVAEDTDGDGNPDGNKDFLASYNRQVKYLAEKGIKPVPKTKIFSSQSRPGGLEGKWGGGKVKQEGIVLVNDCHVAIAEDNDFGLENFAASAVRILQLSKCIKDVWYEDYIEPAICTGPGSRFAVLQNPVSGLSASAACGIIGGKFGKVEVNSRNDAVAAIKACAGDSPPTAWVNTFPNFVTGGLCAAFNAATRTGAGVINKYAADQSLCDELYPVLCTVA